MPRTKPLVLVATFTVLALSAAFSSPAVAAPAGSQPPPTTNVEDFYYDFEVFTAWDITVYTVKYVTSIGQHSHANFYTLAEAEQYENALWNRRKVQSTEIIVHQMQGPFQYNSTFDKRVDAEQFADALEALGFYTDIERVYGLPILSQQSR